MLFTFEYKLDGVSYGVDTEVHSEEINYVVYDEDGVEVDLNIPENILQRHLEFAIEEDEQNQIDDEDFSSYDDFCCEGYGHFTYKG